RMPRRVLRALKTSGWRLSQTPPREGRGEPFEVAKIYSVVSAGLSEAATAERSARLAWLEEMEAAFGPEPKRAIIVESLRAVREAVGAAGIGGAASMQLQTALDNFANR